MTRPDNPLAFPASTDGFGNFLKGTPGMSLRDWFAGQIAAAHCTATDNTGVWQFDALDGAEIIAKRSYSIADAMLLARTPNEIGEEG